jgi:integrase
MASIHRQKGRPYWFVSYFDQNGRRRHKSSKTTNRKEADVFANNLEKAVREARYGSLTPDRARELIEEGIGDIARLSGNPIESQTLQQYLEAWMDGKVASAGTLKRYRGIVEAFVEFLGQKAKGSLQAITDADVQRYRDRLKESVSSGTVNTYLKVIRVALNRAVKKGALKRNPAAGVDNLDRADRHQRRPFTLDEFKELFKNAGAEWRTMLANGLYTGLRLSDCANLTAANLDLVAAHYRLTEKKTKKTRELPIAKPLLEYLLGLDLGDDPAAPLCPNLYGKKESWLSNQFYDLMSSTGLVAERDHQSKQKGRGSRRAQSVITFHSLRYTATSLLKNAGVSDIVARDIIGHESEAVSRNYTVIDEETKRGALDKLPKVLQVPRGKQLDLPL